MAFPNIVFIFAPEVDEVGHISVIYIVLTKCLAHFKGSNLLSSSRITCLNSGIQSWSEGSLVRV